MPGPSLLEDVANDLAVWIDQTATEIAVAFVQTRAPFAARVSNEDKLEFYRSKLFNPDGSPNGPGRDEQLARLGSDGFAEIFKAVTQHWPELKPAEAEPAEITVPDEWPQTPPVGPSAPPPMPLPPGIPAMAQGGIVTKPTLALIGEAGPEAVVPLGPQPGDAGMNLPRYEPPMPPTPSHDEISAYIRQAAQQRGINPDVALQVALHEGTNPATHRFDSPAQEAQFNTGRSYWPFQLHYGGAGTPYAEYGTKAGMGNDFTAATGIQPGDPNAWRESTDFALDQAIANPSGWALWYGSTPAKVAPRQGLPPVRRA